MLRESELAKEFASGLGESFSKSHPAPDAARQMMEIINDQFEVVQESALRRADWLRRLEILLFMAINVVAGFILGIIATLALSYYELGR